MRPAVGLLVLVSDFHLSALDSALKKYATWQASY